MRKPVVSVVSYLNSYPFVYGLEYSGLAKSMELLKDPPARCAERLIKGEAVAGLIPIAALIDLPKYNIISDFVIAAKGHVKSVLLLSQVPPAQINQIVLDSESRSSNALTKVLAKNYWRKDIDWVNSNEGISLERIPETMIAIGDKAFQLAPLFPYKVDLAAEWFDMTGLPFVFAVWAGQQDFVLAGFNEALEWGVNHKAEAVKQYGSAGISHSDAVDYLNHNILYKLNDDCRKAMELFLILLKEITP